MLILVCSFVFSINAYGETKEQSIVTLKEVQDLIVVFTFDVERVDIEFISPSGETFTRDDSGVQSEAGDLWASYKISDAEVGTWKVSYDLGNNTEIKYSTVNSSSGIILDTFTQGETVNDIISFHVKVVTDADITKYNYQLYAVEESNQSEVIMDEGVLTMGEDETCEADLSALSSGTYTFRMEVWAMDGELEVFDYGSIEGYDYTNKETPNTIEDFQVYVNESGLTLGVDWEEWSSYRDSGYYILVQDVDGNSIYEGELLSEVNHVDVTFPEGTTGLTVSLKYKSYDIWSSYLTKTISLGTEEALYIEEGDTTGKSQVSLFYLTTEERTLYLEINGESSEYFIEGEGYLGLNLASGSNTIYGIFEGEEHLFYCVEKEIFYDGYPPEIILYEDLDGATLSESKVHIIGKMNYGTVLTINGTEIDLSEDFGFDYEYALSYGENIVTLEASDANGNTAVQVLTLYRNMDEIPLASEGVKQYLPLLITLGISILLIIWSFFFLKKKEAKKEWAIWKLIVLEVIFSILTLISVVGYSIRFFTIRSIAFLEMAETSVTEAANYVFWQDVLGKVALVGLVISIVVLPQIIRIQSKKKKKRIEEIENIGQEK